VLPASSGFNNDRNWFEVFVVNDVDLNGLVVGRTTSSGARQTTALNAVECLHFPAGSHVLFARRDDPALNGGLPQVDFTVGFTLVDSNGNLFLEFGDDVLDEITWSSSRARTSLALDPDKIDPDENDDEENWKDCDAPYGDGMFGTPGAPNELCDLSGLCLDNGTPRAIVPPQAGQLVITEIMARPDPNATARKWIEVTVIGSQDFDLNGLTVLREGGPERTIEQADCARVSPGDRIVFAHTDDATLNGGLPVVDHVINFTSMLNVSGTNTIVLRHGEDVLESMTYSGSQVPIPEAGRALALDPAKTTPEESSDPANWCLATTPYGDGDPQNFGTPGAANTDTCPVMATGTCIDGDDPRDLVPPSSGDLVLSEIMARPRTGNGSAGEWFEVTALSSVDLNGLVVGRNLGGSEQTNTVSSPNCLRVDPGDQILFARGDNPETNGGLPAVDHLFSFALVDNDSDIFLRHDEVVLDHVAWPTNTGIQAKQGISFTLDPTKLDPVSNADPDNWCDGTTPFGTSDPQDLGTPGAANDDCESLA
jgi:hypothetical protein